jgi:CRISPR/Cas system endoribonuclease Cas6 (RAMP superfamily)
MFASKIKIQTMFFKQKLTNQSMNKTTHQAKKNQTPQPKLLFLFYFFLPSHKNNLGKKKFVPVLCEIVTTTIFFRQFSNTPTSMVCLGSFNGLILFKLK